MRWGRAFVLAALLTTTALPAEAAPVAAAVAAVSTFAASSAIASFVVQMALTAGLTLLQQTLAKKGAARAPGIQTEVTTTGGATPRKFILGTYATGGQLAAPPMSYDDGGTPNEYLVYVLALGCLPGQALSRLIVQDDYIPLGSASGTWGREATGDFAGHLWVAARDGRQNTAFAPLLTAFGDDPDRPWQADMIGRGVSEAIVRFKYNRELLNSLPAVRFECRGIPLYDPRRDSSVGGSGPQRWEDQSTWEWSDNNAVAIYTIMRGIALPSGDIWGGDCTDEDLPLSVWIAAMNECDRLIPLKAGGTERQYRCGYEVALDAEPAAVIEDLLTGCSGQMVDCGGVWDIQVGAPRMPVYFINDGDIVISEDEGYTPYPEADGIYNAVTATYPEPASLWETREAPVLTNAAYEAADGERLVADLQFPTTPYVTQGQRLMAAYLEDGRRMRALTVPLPPDAAILTPLDTVGVVSRRHGFGLSGGPKLFEVTRVEDRPLTMIQRVGLRERDPADYDWTPDRELPTHPGAGGSRLPIVQNAFGFDAEGDSIKDSAGTARRPVLRLTWTASAVRDAEAILWEVRIAGTTAIVARGGAADVAAGGLIVADGILSDTIYQVRGKPKTRRPTDWTGWITATTPEVRLTGQDVYVPGSVQELQDKLDELDAWIREDIAPDQLALAQEQAQLAEGLSDEALARVADVLALADGSRAIRDQLAAQGAEVGELAAMHWAARQDIRRQLASEVGDLRASYGEQILTAVSATAAVSARVTTLEAELAGESAARATAIEVLTTQVIAITGDTPGLRTLAEQVTVLRAEQRLTGGQAADGIAKGFLGRLAGRVAAAEAQQTLSTEIRETAAGVEIVAADITRLKAELPGLATASALEATTTRVTVAEGRITALTTRTTALEAALPGKASASALTALTTRVTEAEGDIDAQASQITSLSSSLNGKASAAAVQSLTTRVTEAEGDIEAVSEMAVGLEADAGRYSAGGRFRVKVLATPSGALSRIGLWAAVDDDEGGSRSAALYLEAVSGGKSRVAIEADQFAVVNGSDRETPLIFEDGVLRLNVAHIGSIYSGVIRGNFDYDQKTGFKIDASSGKITACDIELMRKMAVATGTVAIPANDVEVIVNTGIDKPAWTTAEQLYIARAERISGGTPSSANPNADTWWEVTADVLGGRTYWFDDGKLRIRINASRNNLTNITAQTVRWQLYKVT